MTKHWAFDLIGNDWPESQCWAFVRHVFKIRHGLDVPGLDDVPEVARAWRRCNTLAQADDIVVMRGPAGRHAGVMVEANGRIGVLHAHRTVLFETMHDLAQVGYREFEFWRRRA